MKVLNEYPTHHYIEEYEKSTMCCPSCGEWTVWEEQSPGDYYTGPDFICISCECEFSIQGPHQRDDENHQKKLK